MSWKDIVKKVAPFLGTALPLPPPLGTLAGKLIGDLLGAKKGEDGVYTDEALETALAANPDKLLELKTLELDFKARMEEMGIKRVQDLAALEVDDRKSAREREISVRDKTPALGFYATTAGFFGLLAILIFHQAPEGSRDLLNIMLGALGLAWGNQVKYYYGGAIGDDRVNEMLHQSKPIEDEGGPK